MVVTAQGDLRLDSRMQWGSGVQVQHARILVAHIELGHGGYVIMHLSQVAARDIATQDIFGAFRDVPPVDL